MNMQICFFSKGFTAGGRQFCTTLYTKIHSPSIVCCFLPGRWITVGLPVATKTFAMRVVGLKKNSRVGSQKNKTMS